MVKVVVVNGVPESGKTTFQQMCKNICAEMGSPYSVKIISSVDYVKDFARHAGWNGSKTEKDRKFLSDLKRALTEWDDVIFTDLKNKLQMLSVSAFDWLVFVDIREPEEIARAEEELNATTILIRRDCVEGHVYSNESDNNVFVYEYDHVIDNNGTLEMLNDNAEKFLMEELFPSTRIYIEENKHE